MLRVHTHRFLAASITLAAAVIAGSAELRGENPLALEEVIRSAALKVETRSTDAAVARARLDWLETQKKRKFELKPQFGLLSFTNPALLGASIGAGLLFQQPPAGIENLIRDAKLDLIAAEVEADYQSRRSRLEAVRRYFDLLDSQISAERGQLLLAEMKKKSVDVERFIQVGKLTAVDRTRIEEAALERESEWVQAEAQRKMSSLRLAFTIGWSESPTEIRVKDPISRLLDVENPATQIEAMLQQAYLVKPPAAGTEKELALIGKQTSEKKWFEPSQISLGYAYVTDTGATGGGPVPGYLLGGNTITPWLSWSIPLRKTGEKEASLNLMRAKQRRIDARIQSIREELQVEAEQLRILTTARLQALTLSRKRSATSAKGRELIAKRFEHGLENIATVIEAEKSASAAESGLLRARAEVSASLHALLVLTGGSMPPVELRARVLNADSVGTGRR
jgi:outer membrane protein TolC